MQSWPQHLPQQAAPSIVSLMQPGKRSGWRESAIGALPIVGLIAMLLALAFLQLRWSAKVSEAERARLQQNLDRSSHGFQAAFARDLLEICQTLQDSQPPDQATLTGNLLNRYQVWSRVNRHAALIEGLYIRPQSGGLMMLNPQTGTFEPSSWPDALRGFAGHSASSGSSLPGRPEDWAWNEQAAALVHPLYLSGAHRPRYFGTLFVVFRVPYLEQAYLPGLGRRYFPPGNGFIFQLVDTGSGSPRVVYPSGSHPAAQRFLHPDATVPLLDDSLVYRPSGTSPERVSLSPAEVSRWQLAVRHRSGSMAAAVARLRLHNLAVSIVVLLLLFVSLVTILIVTRRARRLAQLQMEFASGVSHELRTPLTVIRSAAENLADGVVSGPDRVRDYGELIHKETQRLSAMVDHILDFASLHAADPGYRLEPVSVADVFEQVLAGESPLFLAAGLALEVDLADDLPLLLTDAQALGQCLQNLLSNALKYGSDGHTICLTAMPARENGQLNVLIGVQDFGAGIAPHDLPHLYEPFYRSAAARASQIHGTGLGLSVTRKMIEALGGRISAASSPGTGSRFTLHVPAAEPPRSG